MAIIIRPVRGQVTQRALPQGPSMLRLAKAARIPTEGLIDTVDSISKTVINHQNKIEEQRIYNKNVKQQGLLQTELVNYNEQLKNEYSTGDISDEQLIGLFDKQHDTLYNKYKNEVYKDDEKAFKKWEGNFYIQMSQAREKMFAFKNSAIIGQAELTYQDADSQQQLNLSNTNPALLNEDRYQAEYAVKKNALEILSKTQRVDIENELEKFDAKYLQIGLDGLIAPGANGKNSSYYEALVDRLKITDKNQDWYVDKVGGKEISQSERTALIELSESNFLNQIQIEEKKKERVNTPILENIANKQSTGTLTYQDIAKAKKEGDGSLEFLTEVDGFKKRMEESFQGIDKQSDPILFKEIQVLIDKAEVIEINEPFLTNQESQYNKTATKEQQLQPLSLVNRFNEPITSRQSLDEKTYNFFKPQLKKQKNELDKLFESRFKQEITRIRKEIEPRFIINETLMAEFDRKVTSDLYQFAREKFYKDKTDIDTLFNLDPKIGLFYKYYEDNKLKGKKFKLTEQEEFDLQFNGRTPQEQDQDNLPPINDFFEKLE